MEKQHILLADVATFGAIAAVAALFGFSHLNPEVTVIGCGICGISTALAALALAANRPSSS